jgi:hypothetical protein
MSDRPRCPRHKSYKGLNKPYVGSEASRCDICLALYAYNKARGIKGKRPNSKRAGIPLNRKVIQGLANAGDNI